MGPVDELFAWITQANDDTLLLQALARFEARGFVRQAAVLATARARVKKHRISTTTFTQGLGVRIAMPRSRGFAGVYLGWLQVSVDDIRYVYYRGEHEVRVQTELVPTVGRAA